MFLRALTTGLIALFLFAVFSCQLFANTSIFWPDTTKNNDSLIVSDPESYVNTDRVLLTATAEIIAFPSTVRDVYYNGDRFIDSINLSGEMVKEGNPGFASLVNEISASVELIAALNAYGIEHIHRRLSCGSEDAFGDPLSYLYFDFSVYYEVIFMTDVDIVSAVTSLRNRTDISQVLYSGIPEAFTEDPPDPPPDYCSSLNSIYIAEQWALHPRSDSTSGAMGFVNG